MIKSVILVPYFDTIYNGKESFMRSELGDVTGRYDARLSGCQSVTNKANEQFQEKSLDNQSTITPTPNRFCFQHKSLASPSSQLVIMTINLYIHIHFAFMQSRIMAKDFSNRINLVTMIQITWLLFLIGGSVR